MGKRGQPTDDAAMNAKRHLAKRLLDQGVAPAMVMRQLGVSKTWIYAFRQKAQADANTWNRVERRLVAERRSASDRRLTVNRHIWRRIVGERRVTTDRRCGTSNTP